MKRSPPVPVPAAIVLAVLAWPSPASAGEAPSTSPAAACRSAQAGRAALRAGLAWRGGLALT